ncbi:TPA: hypothetical protein ACU6GO_005786 [Pseudomonas aeruginosa]|uniref:hypothetical protein n=1 Tax=Pseudomonas aeruginosa TaxID=287 RepID=UPI00163C11E8|nr:hypothetical protein [Pseudomonas aeruginosa]HBO4520309.1 hypothetical protein [Pseudomonas aeruginosa]HBO6310311.1 hypothetical protein [Pseudomonas aeruginosa]
MGLLAFADVLGVGGGHLFHRETRATGSVYFTRNGKSSPGFPQAIPTRKTLKIVQLLAQCWVESGAALWRSDLARNVAFYPQLSLQVIHEKVAQRHRRQPDEKAGSLRAFQVVDNALHCVPFFSADKQNENLSPRVINSPT